MTDHVADLERKIAAARLSLDRIMSGRAGDAALGDLRTTLADAAAKARAWAAENHSEA